MFDGGRIVEEGSPEQIFTAPQEQRTKDFLAAVL
jgi:polar amino acid transport system ATP-binding protein